MNHEELSSVSWNVRDIRRRARRTVFVSLASFVESLPRRRLEGGDEGEPSRRPENLDAARVSLVAFIFPTSAMCVRIGPRPMLRLRKERRERVCERERERESEKRGRRKGRIESRVERANVCRLVLRAGARFWTLRRAGGREKKERKRRTKCIYIYARCVRYTGYLRINGRYFSKEIKETKQFNVYLYQSR